MIKVILAFFFFSQFILSQNDEFQTRVSFLNFGFDFTKYSTFDESYRSISVIPFMIEKDNLELGLYLTPFIKEVKGSDGNIIKDAHTAPRQLLPKVYQTTADIGVLRLSTLLEKKSVIGDKVLPYHLDRETIDIDTPIDFEIARMMLEKRRKA